MRKKLIPLMLVFTLMISMFTGCQNDKNKSNYEIEKYEGDTFYILRDGYKGEHDIQIVDFINHPELDYDFSQQEIMTYDEYKEYCEKEEITCKYKDKDKNYIVISVASSGMLNSEVTLCDIEFTENSATLYIWDDFYGVFPVLEGYILTVPVDKNIKDFTVQACITSEEFEQIKDHGFIGDPEMAVDKPVIYLYPEKETDVTVSLGFPQNITHSYPLYENSWKVKAFSNGTLIDEAGRELYSLYYEAKSNVNFKVEDEGFVVKGEDTANFLEEKLEILGLNAKEKEEFIIYWLPILENNEYNYIRFADKEEMDQTMPLRINPSPNTVIRILMTFKGLDKPIDIREQVLEKAERKGFTTVEWGGAEIK